MLSHSQGYSLLDLLVASALTCTLFVVMNSALVSEGEVSQLTHATDTLVSGLDRLQLLAGDLKQDIEIAFAPESKTIVGTIRGNPAVQRYPLLTLPGPVSIASAAFGSGGESSPTLTLRSSGSATPGSVVLRHRKGHRCAVIQALYGARRIECA